MRTKKKIYILSNKSKDELQVHTFNPKIDEEEQHVWTHVPTNGTRPRVIRGFSASVLGERIILIGGNDDLIGSNAQNHKAEVYSFHTGTNTWEEVPVPYGAGFTKRSNHAAVATTNNQILVFGGKDETKDLNDIWKATLSF